MSLSDLQSALNMRDLIYNMVDEMVERLRPEEKVGKVFSWDTNTQTARILFAGETIQSLVIASFSKLHTPRRGMSSSWESQGYAAVGDIVRVAGRPGKYYITDYVSGGPETWYTGDIGFLKMWVGAGTYPENYLLCEGGQFLGSSYPVLASIVGDTYGTHSGDTYWLPDYRGRSPMGVGPLDFDNVFQLTVGQKHGDHRLQNHTHAIATRWSSYSSHTHYDGYAQPAQASNPDQGAGVTYTDPTGSGSMQNVHPVIGVKVLVRGK
jgi:microcystin-dependent protein